MLWRPVVPWSNSCMASYSKVKYVNFHCGIYNMYFPFQLHVSVNVWEKIAIMYTCTYKEILLKCLSSLFKKHNIFWKSKIVRKMIISWCLNKNPRVKWGGKNMSSELRRCLRFWTWIYKYYSYINQLFCLSSIKELNCRGEFAVVLNEPW